MTAEVAILNKQCVALAADSAITTGDSKIFNTVNKLFALSKYQPVGIMVYSSAEVMDVPVETIIKEFRRAQGTTAYNHLEDYAVAFESYLKLDKSLFNDESRAESLCDLAGELIQTLQYRSFRVLRESYSWGHPTEDEARIAVSDSLSDIEEDVYQSTKLSTRITAVKRRAVASAIGGKFNDMIDTFRLSLPLNDAQETRLKSLVVDHFFREVEFGGETGFVITGFGLCDVFPRLRSFEFHCSTEAIHKVIPQANIDISAQMIAQIEPFAQRDVMQSYIDGIDPKYKRFLQQFMGGFFQEQYASALGNPPRQTNKAKIINALGKELVTSLGEQLNELAMEEFIQPTMQVVASMPKEELAILAEALVNITALKRKASRAKETVGGPTDVAVISKGDGFIWIKRKHYFEPRYNPGFAASYLQEGTANE